MLMDCVLIDIVCILCIAILIDEGVSPGVSKKIIAKVLIEDFKEACIEFLVGPWLRYRICGHYRK